MMTATHCPSHDLLHAYSCGRLPDDDSQLIYEHLQDCMECQSELNAVDDGKDSLIVDLRADDQHAEFGREPECRIALAKALGALAKADGTDDGLPLMELPAQLGEYEIIRQIGHGGMGRVLLARHTKLGREVALKVIADHRFTDSQTRSRFDAEMRAVGRLSHPNIVTAHDAREVDGLAVLVTEFIDGRNLHQIVARTGPLSLANASEVILKVAAALEYTSDQGFVHRDVKPSNIMISRSGEVKLLDLGLARFHVGPEVELTATGQTMGTADYVAPEQVANAHDADSRSDVYALGCTFFKLLTGHAPFESEEYPTSFAKLTAHVSARPPSLQSRLPNCPNEVAKLVDTMLEKSPDRRPSTPGEVAKTLSRFARGSDLQQLVRQADASLPSPRPVPISTAAASQSWLRRPVPRVMAITCGFFGLLAGLMLGMFLKIKYPDGSEVTLPIGPGTNIEIVAGTDIAADEQAIQPDAEEVPHPRPKPHSGNDTLSRGVNAAQQLTDQLQGIWRITSPSDRTPETEKAVLAYFDGFQFYVATVSTDLQDFSYGNFGTQHDSRDTLIRLEFESAKTPLILSQPTPQDIDQSFSVITQPVKTDGDVMGLPPAQTVRSNRLNFERVGHFPVTQADNRAVLGDHRLNYNDPYVKALMFIIQSQSMGPKQMRDVVSKSDAAIKTTRSSNNLKQIAIGLHNFTARYDQFPGTKNVLGAGPVEEGKHIQPFSWRVAILPLIDQAELFESYRFTEPWDSTHNLSLLDRMPEIYRSPRAPRDQPQGHTNYLGLTTENALMEKKGGTKLRDITDGTSNTILVVESKKTVPWTAPEDLNEYPEFFSPAMYARADGSVNSEEQPDPEQIQNMITIDGGER